jgi:2,3-bisphosphoglycerate-independent phosphoglycerate mutase
MERKKVMLIIMDGWGLGREEKPDAIRHARTPFVSSLYQKYPNTTLRTCGEDVGLPPGQMGNSEVGHLNLGAGRIVYQELQRINVAIKDGSFANNPELLKLIKYAGDNDRKLHLMGLVSDGGVHSHINHLKEIISLCHAKGLTKVYIHAFTDGRDTDPKSGIGFIKELSDYLKKTTGQIATITGRYYAMDRDKRWERVQIAYEALVNGKGNQSHDLESSILNSYESGTTDEFIKPIINGNLQEPFIAEGDAVFCFNFRTDRCREITDVLTQEDKPEQGMRKMDLYYATMTEYDHAFRNVHVIFKTDDLSNTLGEVIARNGRTQLRIAETEKYPHVSFFFSGGRENPFPGEKRIMVPSPKVATYDLQPEMSAREVTDAVIKELKEGQPDFICLNYANPDMVGHTGVWNAIIKAVETVDQCVEATIKAGLSMDYTIFLTADHGNADYAINADGSPNTAHTLNPVPLFIIANQWKGEITEGKLADIAPTILQFMRLPQPTEMTGNILIQPIQ